MRKKNHSTMISLEVFENRVDYIRHHEEGESAE